MVDRARGSEPRSGHGAAGRRYDPAVDRWASLSVEAVGRVLRGTSARAWLSGGAALDHRLGRATRQHGDVDVSVLDADWPCFVGDLPRALEPWWAIDGVLERVVEPSAVRSPNVWCRTVGGDWAVQVNLEAGDASEWRYRRDPSVRLPWDRAVTDVGGVPTVSAAVQLLWKSARPEPKDDADRAAVLGTLTPSEREWLVETVARVHPDSPWLGALRGTGD